MKQTIDSLAIVYVFFCAAVVAKGVDPLTKILAAPSAPAGVVFDIEEWDADALDWAIPMVVQRVEQLRKRFPGLPIAVVSHGDEEFALV